LEVIIAHIKCEESVASDNIAGYSHLMGSVQQDAYSHFKACDFKSSPPRERKTQVSNVLPYTGLPRVGSFKQTFK